MGISITFQGKTPHSEVIANKQIPWYFVNVCAFLVFVWLALFTCLLREKTK